MGRQLRQILPMIIKFTKRKGKGTGKSHRHREIFRFQASTFHRKKVLMKEDTNCWKVTLNSHLELKIRFQFGDFICCVKYFNVTSISDIELHKPKIELKKFPDGYCGLQYSKVLINRLYEICVIPPLELLGITHKWNLKADITLIFASWLSWSERYKENEVLSRTKSDCGGKRLV